MTTIGPYQFSAGDVTSTLAAAPILLDLLTEGLPEVAVDVVAPYRSRAEHALAEAAPGAWREPDGWELRLVRNVVGREVGRWEVAG